MRRKYSAINICFSQRDFLPQLDHRIFLRYFVLESSCTQVTDLSSRTNSSVGSMRRGGEYGEVFFEDQLALQTQFRVVCSYKLRSSKCDRHGVDELFSFWGSGKYTSQSGPSHTCPL